MSEACEKCGADISYQAEHHTNCEVVAELIAHLTACSAKLKQLGQVFSGRNFTDRYGDGPYCIALADNAQKVIKRVLPSHD